MHRWGSWDSFFAFSSFLETLFHHSQAFLTLGFGVGGKGLLWAFSSGNERTGREKGGMGWTTLGREGFAVQFAGGYSTYSQHSTSMGGKGGEVASCCCELGAGCAAAAAVENVGFEIDMLASMPSAQIPVHPSARLGTLAGRVVV
jgi:hypothetical protein